MSRFLDALRSGRVLLMDGAMGTELQRAGLADGERGETWNLSQPERVRSIHRSYAAAGAEVLLTNTFQADPGNLQRPGLGDLPIQIWRAAVDNARAGSACDGFVLADIGPFELVEWPEDGRPLVNAGSSCDGILMETISSFDRATSFSLLFRGQREPPIPFLLSFTFLKDADGKIQTVPGQPPERCAWLARKLGASAVGVNCGRDIGMTEVIEVVRSYRQHLGDRLPIFARPNAGTPERVGGQWVYPRTPESMAERLPELLEAGVNMVGGCCGTTPAHITAFKRVVDAWNAR
jgi:5-methyltetrahydrofolate--homocysteine methyltransferase